MPTKITILMNSRFSPCHWNPHIQAIIEDEQSGRRIRVDYGYRPTFFDPKDCHTATVVLYSDVPLTEFHAIYSQHFGSPYSYQGHRGYNFFTHNCADAVNFVLKYFFRHSFIHNFWLAYKTLFGLGSIATLGLRLCPPPPGISSPIGVFNKALLIAIFNTKHKLAPPPPTKILPDNMSDLTT